MKKIFVAAPTLSGNEKKYVNECLDTSWISSSGKYINEFETSFSKYIGMKHAISCSNGTVALHLPLLALNIGPGDEVILPTFTYIATANAVAYVGAKRVFVDCDPQTWAINSIEIEKKITPRTKAIIVVHLYGHSADMDPIIEIAKKHNLFIIEDCAESLGASYKSKLTGTFGIISTFSFFGNKVITTGEGGMIVTNDDELANKMRIFKGQGMDPNKRYWHTVIGYNYRMTNIEAAIGLAQLEQIDTFLKYRKKIANWYNEALSPLNNFIELPSELHWADHCYWMYSILIKQNVIESNNQETYRSKLMNFLDQNGIETRPLFYPMHKMPPHFTNELFPIADDISSRGINLPTHLNLNQDDIKYIASTIKNFFFINLHKSNPQNKVDLLSISMNSTELLNL